MKAKKTYTIECTTFYANEHGQAHTTDVGHMTYREAVAELALTRRIYSAPSRSNPYTETRFGSGEYGYKGQYANHIFKMVEIV